MLTQFLRMFLQQILGKSKYCPITSLEGVTHRTFAHLFNTVEQIKYF